MVEDRLNDGHRIAELLASEVTGHGGVLEGIAVTDAVQDVEPSPDGAFAYAIDRGDQRAASVFVHPERARVEFERGVDVAADTAREEGLRVRPKAVEPPRTLVFVEDGAQVKWLLPVLRAVDSGESTS
ncbi:hypothetical protein [Halobellus ordinarius]|uniref:hypothetical protein n=1 Tax=Halobellus ordinarius TaxID=3075120 RepID=UPI0028806CA1|nr:hypothetical protein [Halobellus sp. ZY16]